MAKTKENWNTLNENERNIIEDKGTEYPFSGSYNDFKEFMDICEKSSLIWGNSFTYTLLESKDL